MTATVENPAAGGGPVEGLTGQVARVTGPVVDVEFPPDALPEINFAVEMDIEILAPLVAGHTQVAGAVLGIVGIIGRQADRRGELALDAQHAEGQMSVAEIVERAQVPVQHRLAVEADEAPGPCLVIGPARVVGLLPGPAPEVSLIAMSIPRVEDLEGLSRSEGLRASPRMFESSLLERLSRVHPAVPPILFGPTIMFLLVEGIVRGSGWATPPTRYP